MYTDIKQKNDYRDTERGEVTEDKQQGASILDCQLMARHESVVYTYRTHEKAADRYACYETRRRWLSIGLMVLATSSFLVSLAEFLWQSAELGGIITSSVAMLAAGVAFAADYLRYEEKVTSHTSTANELRQIAIGFETLRVDLKLGRKTIDQVSGDRDILLDKEKEILSLAPRTTRSGYEKANKALNDDEKLYSPEAEIKSRDLLAKDEG